MIDRFLREVRLEADAPADGYPYDLPIVRWLGRAGAWRLDSAVTFLVGGNGSGKSTLLEAIAVEWGFNAEGGSPSFRFSTEATHSPLHAHVVLRKGPSKPRSSYFFRGESFYNVASEIDRLDREGGGGPPIVDGYGGVSLHRRSHGESVLDLVTHRFRPNGFYLLDEPEAALSVHSELAVLARMHALVDQGCQFLVATHSPVLLAFPGADIREVGDDGDVERREYEQVRSVMVLKQFLADPSAILRTLLDP